MDDVELLLAKVRDGHLDSLDRLLAGYRDSVRATVALRMDNHLRARLDASDIVQEASLVVSQRIEDYLARRPMSFHLWFRATALECLLQSRRQHVGAECRSAGREIAIDEDSALVLAERLLPSPSQALQASEKAERVRQAVDELPEDDREIILLRTFEGLSNTDAAAILNLQPEAASKRYARAMLRLRDRFAALGISEG